MDRLTINVRAHYTARQLIEHRGPRRVLLETLGPGRVPPDASQLQDTLCLALHIASLRENKNGETVSNNL